MNIFIRLLFLSFLFIGCENSNNDILDSDLEKEFRTAIANTNAEEFKYLDDGLVPQESFFIDSKLKYLKFRFNPEAGFSERRVYFNLKLTTIFNYLILLALFFDNFTIFEAFVSKKPLLSSTITSAISSAKSSSKLFELLFAEVEYKILNLFMKV